MYRVEILIVYIDVVIKKKSIVNPTAPFPPTPPQDGIYTITQVHSAAEFYGVSQMREHDL
ncbi:unnamed protein product, partial [Rotaria magnacalcarata]